MATESKHTLAIGAGEQKNFFTAQAKPILVDVILKTLREAFDVSGMFVGGFAERPRSRLTLRMKELPLQRLFSVLPRILETYLWLRQRCFGP